jgi:hypothetical protein
VSPSAGLDVLERDTAANHAGIQTPGTRPVLALVTTMTKANPPAVSRNTVVEYNSSYTKAAQM